LNKKWVTLIIVQIYKTIMKNPKYIYLIIIAVLVGVIIYFNGCDKKPTISTITNPLEAQKLKEVERLTYELGIEKNKTDSLLKLKPKYIAGKTRIHDSLIYVVDSTCKKAVEVLYVECLKTDSINNNIISSQTKAQHKSDSIIGNQKDVITLKNYTRYTDSTKIVSLRNDSIPKAKRSGYWKGAKHGFILGVATDESLRFGVGKVIP